MIILFFLPFFALLDYWFSYYLPFLPDCFSYLQPQLFLTTILSFFILKIENKKVISLLFMLLFFYDILFSRTCFFKLVTFFLLYRFILYFQRHFHFYYVSYIFFMIFAFVFYFLFQYTILLGIGITDRSLLSVFLLLLHLISFHVIYSTILYYILGIKRKKT